MAWYDTSNNSDDLRDPMGSTVNYTVNNVGTSVYDVRDTNGDTQHASISATAGGPGVGVITIDLPAGYYSGGGFRHAQKVVRLVNETDVARFGGVVTNIDADTADDDATYRPLAVWLW